MRLRAEGVDNAEGKQKIITELYERFFKIAFPRASESLGIVYTPVEIVDFIIRSVEYVLKTEFGASISDVGVHVLDPFTGTGTFIVRLLQSGLIRPDDLLRKYTRELHANEILLLAYYIAAINIEATFHGIAGGEYVPFDGIVLTDTFQMTELGDTMDDVIFPQNNERVVHQKNLDIRVVIGNPPYSVGQGSQNDGNQNLDYPTLDSRIRVTYSADRKRGGNNSLYDSYIRAIRWASDRVNDQGIIAFATNGGYIDSNVASELRQSLAREFHAIHVFNLRGNARTSGELRRKEKDNVFGQGSRSTVAIMLLVKRLGSPAGATIRYRDVGDYLTRQEKLAAVAASAVDTGDWQTITPNAEGDWINQRSPDLHGLTPIGAKVSQGRPKPVTVFANYSRGLETGRDAWVYNYSAAALGAAVQRMIGFYNEQVHSYQEFCAKNAVSKPNKHVDEFIDLDPTKISWTLSLKRRLGSRVPVEYSATSSVVAVYRPFSKQRAYFDRSLNHILGQLPKIFPTTEHHNFGLYCVGMGSAVPFSILAIDSIPDLHVTGAGSGGQFFPRYTYHELADEGDLLNDETSGGFARVDNVTDEILADYRIMYGAGVSKDDIFYYVYGLLHSPMYREQFAADLKKMLPKIPKVARSEDFSAFVEAGRELAGLHMGYESVALFPLREVVRTNLPAEDESLYRVRKMVFGKPGKSTIVYNAHITLIGVPAEAYEYMLGSRSAIEWVMERYQVKTDKPSGIVNDPNDWSVEVGDPRYILDLLKRIVTVSVETVRIVKDLPALDLQ